MNNKDIANVFRKAKRQMGNGMAASCPRYICWAIDDSEHFSGINAFACRTAKQIINQRLDGEASVESWLEHNVPEAKKLGIHWRIDRYPIVQAYRLLWLDALIAEFDCK